MARKPVPNVALLDATLAEVRKAARRKKGERWDQEVYRSTDECGTAMCFAGWALTLSGDTWATTIIPDADEDLVLAKPADRTHAFRAESACFDLDLPKKLRDRLVVTADHAAAKRLGLSSTVADTLFHPDNTLPDLTRIVRQIKAGEL